MADALQHIESHWNSTVIPSILEQYKDSEKWQMMLKAVIDQMQIAEDAAAELTTVLDFESEVPTGDRLDFIAGLVNVTRMAGETDELFYTRFITSLGNRRAGTPDFVINSTKFLSLDPHPQYIDEAPATFLVYTGPKPNKTVSEDSDETVEDFTAEERECVGGGNQLLRRQVQQTAPAGVLGLPGQAIHFADGGMMCDAQGRLFLAAFNDEDVDLIRVITDDQGRLITDGDGRVLTF